MRTKQSPEDFKKEIEANLKKAKEEITSLNCEKLKAAFHEAFRDYVKTPNSSNMEKLLQADARLRTFARTEMDYLKYQGQLKMLQEGVSLGDCARVRFGLYDLGRYRALIPKSAILYTISVDQIGKQIERLEQSKTSPNMNMLSFFGDASKEDKRIDKLIEILEAVLSNKAAPGVTPQLTTTLGCTL